MIDVALKVGELTGGMAEGSIATYQTDGEPLSEHMKKVFAVLRVPNERLHLIEKAFSPSKRAPRSRRMPLRALARALGQPGLERRWRGRGSVEPVDVSQLDLRAFMRRGYTVRTPKHPDLNAVTAGKYTVGRRASYSDWNAALADIGTSIIAELLFTQITNLSYAMAGVTGMIELNEPDARVIFKSANILKGNAGNGLMIEDTSRTSDGFIVKARATVANAAAYVEMRDLYFTVASGAAPISSRPLARTEGWSSGERALFKVHNCIFEGNGKLGHGLTQADDNQRFQMWNCKFGRFNQSGGRGASIHGLSNSDSFVENCVFVDNDYGLYQPVAGGIKVNNCVAFSSVTKDFFMLTPQDIAGDNNVSDDATAAEFNGLNNLSSQGASINLDYEGSVDATLPGYLRLKSTASLLPAAGKAPEIPGNTSGSIGNSRPGANETYSAGADELEEVFPTNWALFTKLTINGEKVAGSGQYTMPVLITERTFMITDEIWNNSRDDGGDLRLTREADGADIRPIEVVTWDRVNRKCEIWAAVVVDASADMDLYLWSGNPYAAQPEPNDNRSNRGSFYVWRDASQSTIQGFVYHCANDIGEKYAYDSSPAKAHAPIFINPLPQTDGLHGYGSKLEFWEALSYWLEFGNTYEFTDSAQHGFMIMHMKSITAGGSLVYMSRNAGTTPRVELKDQGSPSGFTIRAEAGDGSGIQAHATSILIDDQLQHILGARIDLGAKEIDGWVDGVKTQSTGLPFPAASFTAGTHDLVEIGRDPGGPTSRFFGQEIRYWSSEPYGYSENDGFWETHATMVSEQADFWSCGDLHGQSQKGPRKWQFLVPEVGCFGIENTDFWVEYTANLDGTLSAILHAVWDAGSGVALTHVEKRAELESRLEELRHTFETLRGDLLIDEGETWEKLIRGVQLSAVSLNEGKTNAALDYDVTFTIGLAGLGMRSIARSLEFGTSVLNAGNFLVEYASGDRTVFKDVFRAAPIRVPSGPPTRSVLVTAIVESIAAATPLARRQKAEEILKLWAWDRLGEEGELKIDGDTLGTAHLATVQPSNLELPDAVVFDLEFLTNYGS